MSNYIIEFLNSLWLVIMSLLKLDTKRIPPKDSMQVFVRTNIGEQVCVSVQPSWTVHKIKSDVASKLQTSEEKLKIVFAGKELPDNLTISQCDLGNRSTLHAIRIDSKLKKTSTFQEINEEIMQDDNENTPEKELHISNSNLDFHVASKSTVEARPTTRPKLLCDPSTVMTIQLTDEEIMKLSKLKSNIEEEDRPHFYVYCVSPCNSVCIGKLRVRCSQCKGGALTLHRDPSSWDDVLNPNIISATCETSLCSSESIFGEFFFKCGSHETRGEDDTAVVLHLLRANVPRAPCLTCSDVSSPVVVFACDHVTCLDCFVTYCVSRLNERRYVSDPKLGYTLPCPNRCENSMVVEPHHFHLMGSHHYDRYQRFGAEEALLSIGGVLCPFPGCGQGIEPDPDCRSVRCMPGCGYVFCKECLQGYHLGECLAENEIVLQEATPDAAFGIGGASISSWENASRVAVKTTTKPCPQCRTPTERSGGCMHMVCTRPRCRFGWCWVCQTEWTRECMAAHWFA